MEAHRQEDAAAPTAEVFSSVHVAWEGTEILAQEVCERLVIAPQQLRHILDEFAELLPLARRDGRTYFEPLAFSRLQLIHHWRGQGLSSAEIRQRLLGANQERQAEEPAEARDEAVVEQLAALAQSLEESQRQRSEERDRLMMSLARLQQEVQHLRYELHRTNSRQERKKGGLLGRVFR